MENLERLLIDVKESLERQIADGDRAIVQELREGFASMSTRFDNQAARLDRQGAL